MGGWLASYPFKLGVQGGETLKDIAAFPGHVRAVAALIGQGRGALRFVALGGGTVGDFCGFLASIWKRGCPVVQIPSTWLAAVDSSQGGKTALNIPPLKNQLGTFHYPREVYLVESLLRAQPEELAYQALPELLKIALIDGPSFWGALRETEATTRGELLWNFLLRAVKAKRKVLDRDPLERTGGRSVLNLGHTLGHVIEGHYGFSHGEAVGHGLRFALDWSYRRGFLAEEDWGEIQGVLREFLPPGPRRVKPLSSGVFRALALGDKKVTEGGKLNFVFLRRPGEALVEEVQLRDFEVQALDQGWVRL